MPGKVVTIGLSLPLSGGDEDYGGPVRDGVQLAIDEAALSKQLPGFRVKVDVRDYRFGGLPVRKGAVDMQGLIDDQNVVAVVGPMHSFVARAQIPLSNSAGLLECSPNATDPALTKGNEILRPVDRVSFIRVSPPDDLAGVAQAHFGRETLSTQHAGVVDDGSAFGVALSGSFAAEWRRIGGSIVGTFHVADPTEGYVAALEDFRVGHADVVFYAGPAPTGSWSLRRAMASHSLGGLPFLGGPDLVDGSGAVAGSFIARAAETIGRSYAALPYAESTVGGPDFNTRFEAAFGGNASAGYAEYGYACAQVILAALKESALDGTITREEVRAAATSPGRTFATALGPVGFDKLGDTTLRVFSVYKADKAASFGPDWSFAKQLDLAQLAP